jgi:hypothetical protein
MFDKRRYTAAVRVQSGHEIANLHIWLPEFDDPVGNARIARKAWATRRGVSGRRDSLMHQPLALGAVEREGRPFGILDAQFTTVVVAEGEPIRVALEMLLIALLVYAAPPRRMRQYSPSG